MLKTIATKIKNAIPYAIGFAAVGYITYHFFGGRAAYLVVLGGLVGATTNALAIGLLFRKYFKWGDYVGENYKEFTQNMTHTVKELVNYKTVAPVMEKPGFMKAIKNTIRNAIEEKLPEKSGRLKLEEIDGIENSVNNIVASINKSEETKELLEKIIEIVGQYPLGKIISQEQFKHITGKIDTDDLISQAEKKIGNMTLCDFIVNNDNKTVSKALLERLIDFAKSDEGNKLLVSAAEKIIENLEGIKVKLSDIISEQTKNNLETGLKNNLPIVMNKIVQHINKNRGKIENLINDSIDEALSSGDFMDKIILLLKEIFIKNLAKEFNLVGKIEDVVKKYANDPNAGEELTEKFIKYIEKENIGTIICTLRKELPSRQLEKWLVELLIANLQDIQNSNLNPIDEFLSKRIANIGKIDLSIIKTDLLPHLYEKICKTEIKNVLPKDFANNAKLSKSFFWNNCKKIELREICDLVPKEQKENFYAQFVQKIPGLMEKNSDTVENALREEITDIAGTKLNNFPKEKVVEAVNVFIGKHLKIITAIGAGAGVIAGAIMYFCFHITGFESRWIQFAVMALVGWGTNCLAIWSLFHPEKPIYGNTWIPGFSLAIKEQKKFSEAIADFINEKALEKEFIKKSFSSKKQTAKDKIGKYLDERKYDMLDIPPSAILDAARSHINIISKKIGDYCFSYAIKQFDMDKYVLSQNEKWNDYISKNTIKQFAGKEAISAISHGLSLRISDKLPDISLFLAGKIEKIKFGKKIHNFFLKQIDHIADIIQGEIAKNKSAIKEQIYAELGPLVEVIAKSQIDKVVDLLIDTKLREYFYTERDFFIQSGSVFFELGIRDEIFVKTKLESSIDSILSSQTVKTGLENIVLGAVNHFSDINLIDFLKLLGITNLSDLIAVLKPIVNEIYPNINAYNEELLKRELSAFIRFLEKEHWNEIETAASPLLKNILMNISTAVEFKTKRHIILDIIVEALLDSIEDNLDVLIQEMNIKDIVYNEVSTMPVEKIGRDGLFKFVDPYFKRIEISGLLGGFQHLIILVWLIDELRVIRNSTSP